MARRSTTAFVFVLATALLLTGAPYSAGADTVRKACLKSDRDAANRTLCGCIQKAADASLSRRDQKLAASFFTEPHKSQEIRQSNRRTHEKFWDRYKTFSEIARIHCAPA